MTTECDRDAVWQALNLGFYAMAQLLEQAGVLDQDRLADQLLRFDASDRPVLAANLRALIETLRLRPFAPPRPHVEGGDRPRPALQLVKE